MGDYEFFKKEFEFHGKHARMAGELWVKNDYGHTYFKRLIDLYVLAAVVGFRIDRRGELDYAPFQSLSIFPEQMIHAKEELDFIMQMIIIRSCSTPLFWAAWRSFMRGLQSGRLVWRMCMGMIRRQI